MTVTVTAAQPVADVGLRVVLDGELAAGAGTLADFYCVGPAVAHKGRSEPVTFVAFDVLWFETASS